ncbi:MAG TPA: protein-methionine-sulfoxide reductase catalytic subunit MsrP [Methylomirabilota bacterium]|nr:protein-methionine-sulfoxide reductase catalytic subunit MsrP [Methylomirabilota bacterium]
MANVIIRPDWHIADKFITPEKAYLNRRLFLRGLGFTAGAATLLGASAPGLHAVEIPGATDLKKELYPAKRNPEFDPKWKLSDENEVFTYNNFYEFSTSKNAVVRLVKNFTTAPWPIEITGMIENPLKLDAGELVSMFPLEERVYRFRCVEAWAMIVPWTGFQLSKLIEKVKPTGEAKFVKFVTFNKPEQAPGMADKRYPWPYTEGLRLDEAMHPLTIVATGLYGRPLPKQNGAPVRIVVPWKYGYKSIKSIVRIEFTDKQPKTLWETMAPDEYPFESNVNPAVPHPRWSQATERMIDSGDRVRTQPYNGYAAQVAKLYPKS